jgi:Holliday junction resolvase RusA-like endonuclease
MSTTITINGDPVGKPRMTRADKWKKRPIVVYYRGWADNARRACTGLADKKIEDDSVVEVQMFFYFSTPSSWSAKKCRELSGQPHRVRPDLDNCVKSVMDALFALDSTVYKITAQKMYASPGEEPRTVVKLITLPE